MLSINAPNLDSFMASISDSSVRILARNEVRSLLSCQLSTIIIIIIIMTTTMIGSPDLYFFIIIIIIIIITAEYRTYR